MGERVCYVSALPQNALSREILDLLQKRGVDTSRVFFSGDRIGTYILLSANGLSKGEVIYDRKHSAFSQLRLSDVDTDNLLEGVDWLHWTALTPALNETMALIMAQILRDAKEREITISVDLNYRDQLWRYGKRPDRVMPQLARHCDVVMGNIWAANKMLGTSVDPSLDRNTPKETYLKAAEASAGEVFREFPNCRHLAYTFRFMDGPRHNLFYGTYHTPDGNAHSQTRETFEVVDRIGSGDAFMAGLIHGLVRKKTPQEIIDTATEAGFQKLFVRGDFAF